MPVSTNKGISDVYLEEQPVTRDDVPQDGTVIYRPNEFYFDGEHTRTEGDYRFVANERLANYKMIVGGSSRNLYNQLQKIIKSAPNGPYMVDSRDDSVTVHNRNWNQAPIATYSYAGGNGEFLSLTIKTKKKEKNIQATQSSSVDPKTKEVKTTVTQSTSNEDDVPKYLKRQEAQETRQIERNIWAVAKGEKDPDPDEIRKKERQAKIDATKDIKTTKEELQNNLQLTQQEAESYQKIIRERFSKDLDEAIRTGDISKLVGINSLPNVTVKRRVPVQVVLDPANWPGARTGADRNTAHGNLSQTDVSNYARRWEAGMNYILNNPSIIFMGYEGMSLDPDQRDPNLSLGYNSFPSVRVIMDKTLTLELDGARIFASATPHNLQKAFGKNNLANSTVKQIEGSLNVIGNTSLRSSRIIKLLNISRKYSGNWYTTKVRHTISNGGYLCSCELIKRGIPVSLVSTTSNISTNDIYQQFHKLANDPEAAARRKRNSDIRQEFTELYSSNDELRNKSLVVDVREYDGKNIPVKPASEDYVNLNEERERIRSKK